LYMMITPYSPKELSVPVAARIPQGEESKIGLDAPGWEPEAPAFFPASTFIR